ncbi:MAG: hypothetical protein AAFU67_05855, partial [Bacteroidota bacterium]
MRKKSFSFQPARVVEGKSRWYIIWYADGPDGEPNHRYRETFNLNRILHIPTRRHRSNNLVKKINWWLEANKNPWSFDERIADVEMRTLAGAPLGHTPAVEAIEVIRKLKNSGAREASKRSIDSTYGLFISYLKVKGWDQYPIGNLKQMHASKFMDFRLISGISNTTYNNNLNYLKGAWIALKAKSYVEENIFSSIPRRKQKPKKRRAFTAREAKVVVEYIRKEDELLFYGIILQYCCHIRPVELRRLRRRHFDLENRFVEVPGRESKSHEERFPAIPDSFIGLFRKEFWDAIPRNYLVFGKDWQPNRSEPCNKSRMYKKHKKALQHLAKCGELD